MALVIRDNRAISGPAEQRNTTHTHTHRHSHRHKRTHAHTHTHTERERERERERENEMTCPPLAVRLPHPALHKTKGKPNAADEHI